MAGVVVWTGRTGANTAGGLVAEAGGAVKLLEFDTIVLGEEEIKEKGCVAGAVFSTDENLSFRLSFTVFWGATL